MITITTITFCCPTMEKYGHCSCHCCGHCHNLKAECTCNGFGAPKGTYECQHCYGYIPLTAEHDCLEDEWDALIY